MRLLAGVAVFALCVSSPVLADPANSFAIRDVRVFDGDRTIDKANVVVTDGRIAAVGPDAAIPNGVPVIDGAGKTLLPGLIDAHVHVFPGAQKDALRFGVTTELDMFDVSHDHAKWKAQRESLARTDEADTWASGVGVTVKGGAPIQSLPPGFDVPSLDSAGHAKAFVDARVAEGSDYIKSSSRTCRNTTMAEAFRRSRRLKFARSSKPRMRTASLPPCTRKPNGPRAKRSTAARTALRT